MILFTTMLDINDNLKQEEFIQLLIDSNQQHHHHKENVIPKEEIQWDQKQLENTFGDNDLSLRTKKYINGEILAAKFEKKEGNGMSWQTEYVWNLVEKKMSIRLSRTYRDDATTDEQIFSPPSFIKYLIMGGYIRDDNGLQVSDQPIVIGRDNMSLLTDAANDNVHYKFPIVYVSKRIEDNKDPLDVKMLAKKLRGVAHVFVEEDNQLDVEIAHQCEDKHTFGGAITVYYPNKVFDNKTVNRNHEWENNTIEFINKILDLVLYYMNRLELPPLYTWDSVNGKIKEDQLTHNKKERRDAEDSWEKAENESVKYKKQMNDYKIETEILKSKNQSLLEKTKGVNDIELDLGEITEAFPGEAKEVILDALEEQMKNYQNAWIRRYNILKSVIDGNENPKKLQEIHKKLKKILKSCDGDVESHEDELKDLGITKSKDKKHPGYIYIDDEKYLVTQSSTGSDRKRGRGAKNGADDFIKVMF